MEKSPIQERSKNYFNYIKFIPLSILSFSN
jgi:hypothetical protein